jgi:hypothetical protein
MDFDFNTIAEPITKIIIRDAYIIIKYPTFQVVIRTQFGIPPHFSEIPEQPDMSGKVLTGSLLTLENSSVRRRRFEYSHILHLLFGSETYQIRLTTSLLRRTEHKIHVFVENLDDDNG